MPPAYSFAALNLQPRPERCIPRIGADLLILVAPPLNLTAGSLHRSSLGGTTRPFGALAYPIRFLFQDHETQPLQGLQRGSRLFQPYNHRFWCPNRPDPSASRLRPSHKLLRRGNDLIRRDGNRLNRSVGPRGLSEHFAHYRISIRGDAPACVDFVIPSTNGVSVYRHTGHWFASSRRAKSAADGCPCSSIFDGLAPATLLARWGVRRGIRFPLIRLLKFRERFPLRAFTAYFASPSSRSAGSFPRSPAMVFGAKTQPQPLLLVPNVCTDFAYKPSCNPSPTAKQDGVKAWGTDVVPAKDTPTLNLRDALSALTLELKETEAVRITEKVLVGKLLSTRIFKRFTLLDIIKQFWRLKGKVQIEKVSDNIFKFSFIDKSKRDNVFERRPYMIDHVTSRCKFVEPATVKSSLGVVLKLYSPWLHTGVAGSMVLASLKISDDLSERVIADVDAFNSTKTNHAESYGLSKSRKRKKVVVALEKSVVQEKKDGTKHVGPDCFHSISSMCPEVDALRLTIRENFRDGDIDFQSLVLNKGHMIGQDNGTHGMVEIGEGNLIVDLSSQVQPEGWKFKPIMAAPPHRCLTKVMIPATEPDFNRRANRGIRGIQGYTFMEIMEVTLKKGKLRIYRGLGRSEAVLYFVALVRKWRPSCMFLLETKSSANDMEKIHRKLRLEYYKVVEAEGHLGGLTLMWNSTFNLKDFLHSVGGLDLGFAGIHYTWINKKERLDRAVANLDWIQWFPDCSMNLKISESDQASILVRTSKDEENDFCLFRFLEAWTLDRESAKVVERAWTNITGGDSQAWKMNAKLSVTAKALQFLNKHYFRQVHSQILSLEEELRTLQIKEDAEEEPQSIRQCRIMEELRIQRARQELIYKQKSREL
ncbi:hypothetical protein FNV43_RR13489 [Rhamnella rubrinervis]|uniref:Uncharacterized protein n=1 Tax=Rhamnella rubrinervis TaxID=2594499 RepID=A0A8K0H181_9ROSA|nr:hypothetical protein FNV43_RR13489 [Rhamnella rubrinervis]